MANILPVFLPFAACGNICLYCNQHAVTNTSFNEDIVDFAESQIIKWKNIASEWREIAFYGGNFGAIPVQTRKELYALAKKYYIRNIRYSTRPDTVTDELTAEMDKYGVTTVELGVQSLDAEVLRLNGRPYTCEKVFDAISAVSRVTECGVQLMTGMYAQNTLSAAADAGALARTNIKYARIYPTLVLEGTQLADIWRNGGYMQPTLGETLATVCAMYIHFTANSVKVIRMGLPDDISQDSVLAGAQHPALGDMVKTLCAMLYSDRGGTIKFAGYKGLARIHNKDAYNNAEHTPDFVKASKHLERYLLEDSERFIKGAAFELAEKLSCASNHR